MKISCRKSDVALVAGAAGSDPYVGRTPIPLLEMAMAAGAIDLSAYATPERLAALAANYAEFQATRSFIKVPTLKAFLRETTGHG